MKLYMASSWKNEEAAISLARVLRGHGHEVDCFCEPGRGRFVFHWSKIVNDPDELQQLDSKSFLADARTQRAFLEDKKWLDWCGGVVLLLPAGRSAHLEAGYAVGQGKPVWAWSLTGFPKGEFDVMYGFFRGLYGEEELDDLLRALNGRIREQGDAT